VKRDVERILSMGIMEDVTITLQPVGGEANLSSSHFFKQALLSQVPVLLMILCRF
jgi:hypothetical protein